METNQHLFKELEAAERLFSDGSIKNAQKRLRNVLKESKALDKIPNKLRHKINAAIIIAALILCLNLLGILSKALDSLRTFLSLF